MDTVVETARSAVREEGSEPAYQRLASALARVAMEGTARLPSARALAAASGLSRATVTEAYRELARRGVLVLRRGRPRRGHLDSSPLLPIDESEPPAGVLDLARYAPDRELIPPGRLFEWLGLGEGEGEGVEQYGTALGYPPLRSWIAARLRGQGVDVDSHHVLLTAGAQHALDLIFRTLVAGGDAVLVEDPTYPGMLPLLAMHRVRPLPVPVAVTGLDPDDLSAVTRRHEARLAILTPTLHNPSGTVLDRASRLAVLESLTSAGTIPVEEYFDPGLVIDGTVPPPLAALSRRAILVGSFSKALFPGLRVGWIVAGDDILRRLTAVKTATDLSGSPFLEAAAYGLCRRGILDEQLRRLRLAAATRSAVVLDALAAAPPDVRWSRPRGGFSLQVELPPSVSSQALAARAAASGTWVLPGPRISVTGRDNVTRIAFAAVGGATLRKGIETFVKALSPGGPLPLV